MADQPVTREKLINADKDVQVIEDFIKKPKDETVTTRFGDEIMTLKGLEEEVKKSGGYFKRYASLSAANADIGNIPVGGVVKVTDAVDGGDYEKATAEATSLTKSQFSPATTEDLNNLELNVEKKASSLDVKTNEPVAIAITFMDGHRTWLEVGPDGKPSAHSEGILRDLLGITPSEASVQHHVPMFRRMSTPLIEYHQQSADTMYWPWAINKAEWGGRGIALFYSTDHASNHNTSGIYLLEADSVEGPWIDRGRIYRDDVDGNQTETPSVIYDKTTNKLLMFYQQAATAGGIGSQQTLLATAETSDLTTWTRVGVVLDKELAAQDGEGHSGYFRPFRFCGETMGYSLYGGGNVSNASLWRSKDGGYTWCRDGSMIGYMQDKCKHLASILETPSHHCILTIYEGDVMIWNGQPWWIGVVGKAQAGSIPVRNSRLVAAPLSDDFTSLKCNVVDITPEKASYETVTGIDYPGNIFEFEGEYYSAYRTGGQKGAIGLMKMVNG